MGGVSTPNSAPTPYTWYILLSRWNDGQATVGVWVCLLLLSTRQLNSNALPRCAHINCTCVIIWIGFELSLLAKIWGLFLWEQVIASNYNYRRSGMRVVALRTVPPIPINWFGGLACYYCYYLCIWYGVFPRYCSSLLPYREDRLPLILTRDYYNDVISVLTADYLPKKKSMKSEE